MWLLPPGILVLLLLVGGLAWRRWWGRAIVGLSSLLLLLLSMTPVRDLITMPLEGRYPPLTDTAWPTGAAIVVLGGGVQAQAPEYGGRSRLSDSTLMRITYAADLARRHPGLLLVSGGNPLQRAQETEGEVMRRRLRSLGIASKRIIVEQGSLNSWQNALLIRPLLQARGIQKIVLVTDAWHMPRAVWCFMQQGIDVIAAPNAYHSTQRHYDMLDWMPNAGALNDSSQALHEYLGILYYRLRFGA
ncbi:MAG: YdcF family protein [Mariprofundales bacterium]